jgi:lipopolysaccharide/colanic/teichoic acid biosynthesis glycosyltransferase
VTLATDAPSPRPFQRVAKRASDIVAAATGLIVFSPLLLLASLAIKLDGRGSIFYSQIEYRYNDQTTRVLKFRSTTSVRADEQSSYLRRLDHLLRQTGIDGLPMLINVLRGEISIVGPCSYATPAQFYDSWDTCNTPKAIQRQIEHDLFYVAN